MTYLLDTHAVLWFLQTDAKLNDNLLGIIRNPSNRVLVSVASIWEIAIKKSLGKLKLEFPFDEIFDLIRDSKFELIPIKPEHFKKLVLLDFHHRDPFDRMLAAVAIAENCDLISIDDIFDLYFEKETVKRVW